MDRTLFEDSRVVVTTTRIAAAGREIAPSTVRAVRARELELRRKTYKNAILAALVAVLFSVGAAVAGMTHSRATAFLAFSAAGFALIAVVVAIGAAKTPNPWVVTVRTEAGELDLGSGDEAWARRVAQAIESLTAEGAA
ncbi:hypothetical protein BH09MYX1_BH09MYX1_16050 [soil metagenome]